MHRIFRKALDAARGNSQFIIVVMTDVRGFSAFSQNCESPDTAMFLKRVYIKMIDAYFNFASFYKSTGDGLLLTIPFNESNLREMSQKTVESCIACHSEFGHICNKDPMIRFKVPDKIGIGIARGTACCLISGRKIIDYSGRLLNLTSRLMDLARPSGIVIDSSFGIDLLDDKTRQLFNGQEIYLDGIAEEESMQVYYTKKFTTIPQRNRRPISVKRWHYIEDEKRFRELLKLGRFGYDLEYKTTGEDIKVTVEHAEVTDGKVSKKYKRIIPFEGFTYALEAAKPTLWVNFPQLCEILKRGQVKNNMKVFISIAYVERW